MAGSGMGGAAAASGRHNTAGQGAYGGHRGGKYTFTQGARRKDGSAA